MNLCVESNGDCRSCPNLHVLTDSCAFAINRGGYPAVAALENALEAVADRICGGCSREEPVAVVRGGDAVVNLFPGRRAA
ncbi:hypothetical protein C5748_07350 [Phyllobacterium phragmitis]|uniref:Uncharacterized protein n=1 Tax=Phyllobacterium phragmitis TaxID=2670329 RepID=A0A2S9IV25_9HYPH|nr:hypothetical protein C5748_07350 [Phyllobacterium phragmitis]